MTIAINKTVRIDWPGNELHGKRGHVVSYVGTRDEFWTVNVDGWSVMVAANKLVPVRPVTTWVDEAEPQGAPKLGIIVKPVIVKSLAVDLAEHEERVSARDAGAQVAPGQVPCGSFTGAPCPHGNPAMHCRGNR